MPVAAAQCQMLYNSMSGNRWHLPSLAPNWLLLYNDLFNWSVRFKCQNTEFNWKYSNQPQILETNVGINVK